MNYVLMGPQLLAAWSVQIHIVWWRFCLSLFILGAMCAAAWALERKK
ncbi:MAG TPA: hypothetical protein VK819_12785 [Acidobacteriaceae bacterium]|jgi:hypothetical protein|nr:hypothetical protein [Acidobacteriaceae bacterium]